MAFFCLRCGECCSVMGDMIRISEELDDFEFRIFYQYTGEERKVRVDQDKRELFIDRSIFIEEPKACPFFRKSDDGLACCTVHDTWPDICMEYSCWTMLIMDSKGKRAGRVMDLGHFSPDDPELAIIWKKQISILDNTELSEWEEKVTAILAPLGFTVYR